MTVRELINELKRANPDAQVEIEHPSVDTWSAHAVDLTASREKSNYLFSRYNKRCLFKLK